MEKPEFNNGFIIAITLFLEHRDNYFNISREERKERGYSDHRIYCATDHLYDLEIPKSLFKNHKALAKRIVRWRIKCFSNRLLGYKKGQYEINDKLFREAEDILVEIDQRVFKTKKIILNYR